MISLTLFTIFAIPFALAAPTSVDSETLLHNAQLAQKLNAEFSQLNTTDACDFGQLACVKGSRAQCASGSWELTSCPDSQQCFALPSVRGNGTTLECTSPSDALSIMSAAGATAELASSNSTDGNVTFPSISFLPLSSSPSISATQTNVGDSGVATVTVTVTESSETLTLDPAAASSLIASLTANGSFSVVSTVLPTRSVDSSVATATGQVDGAAVSAACPAATTIPLTNLSTVTTVYPTGVARRHVRP